MKSKLKYVLSFVFITGLVLALYNNCGKVNFGAANVASKVDDGDNGGLSTVDCAITPDDPSCPHEEVPSLPKISIGGPATVIEGQVYQFSVVLDKVSDSDIAFVWQTVDGQGTNAAVSPDDFTAVPASQFGVITAGQLELQLQVNTIDDSADEASAEYFSIVFSLEASQDTTLAEVNGSNELFVSILDNDETAGEEPPPDVPEFVDDPGNPPDMEKYACGGGKYLLCHVQGDPLGNTLCLPSSSISSHESGHTNEGLMEGFENNTEQYPIKDYFGSCRHTVVAQ